METSEVDGSLRGAHGQAGSSGATWWREEINSFTLCTQHTYTDMENKVSLKKKMDWVSLAADWTNRKRLDDLEDRPVEKHTEKVCGGERGGCRTRCCSQSA